jgi:capsular polysaccharide export protein
MSFPRRGRRLTLDALVAGTLILYPRYYDWGSGTVCDAEGAIDRLALQSAAAGPLGRPERMLRRIARYVGGWVHA